MEDINTWGVEALLHAWDFVAFFANPSHSSSQPLSFHSHLKLELSEFHSGPVVRTCSHYCGSRFSPWLGN